MSPLLPACFFILLLDFSGAKPASAPQTLKQPHSSEEVEVETEVETEVEGQPEGQIEGQREGQGADGALLGGQLDSTSVALRRDDALMRLLKDLLRTSRRSRSRYKKGGLRSCFGVRLARIGSFSGLGC